MSGARGKRWVWGVLAGLGAAVASPALAQGNLSTQGFGYPPGEVSTAAVGSGSAFGEFDPVSAINPAALGDWGRAGAHFQYQPEFRSVNTPAGTDNTTTVRFPLLSVGVPIGSHFVLGLSLATLLDRSWETTQTQQITLGDTLATSVETFRSTGGISDVRLATAWAPLSWLHAGLGFHVFSGRNQIAVNREFPDTTVIKALPFSDTSTFSYVGIGLSAGLVLRPSPVLSVAGSLRLGGDLRVHRNDSLQSKAAVPPRAGASVRYDGIPGVSLALRGDWEGWARMNDLGSENLHPADALGFGVGADVAGPRLSADREIRLRLGARTETLPFRANGAIVREKGFSGGVGVPFGGERAALDVALERELRSAAVQGVSEGAWTLSVGLTLRP